MFNRYTINLPIVFILIGTFLTNATYWVAWPFIAIILNKKYGISVSNIGLMLSVVIITTTFIGIYLGHISDKVGHSTMLIVGCIIGTISFIGLGLSTNMIYYTFSMILVGISRAVVEPISKAIFSQIIDNEKDRESILQIRYFIVNLGVAIGPLLGVYLSISGTQYAFYIVAFSYIIYIILITILIKACKFKSREKRISPPSFFRSIKNVSSDRAFIIFILSNIFLWIVFIQFESTVALYLSSEGARNTIKILGAIISTNAITIVLFQFPVMYFLKKIEVSTRIYIGIVLLGISQLLFAYISIDSYLGWIMSTIIFSISELVIVPNLNIKIDIMAPNHLKGSYYAMSSMYKIGCGAYIGGILLQNIGGHGLFFCMFFVCLISISLCIFSNCLGRKKQLIIKEEIEV